MKTASKELAARLHAWLVGRQATVLLRNADPVRAWIVGASEVATGELNPTQDLCILGKIDGNNDGYFMVAGEFVAEIRWDYTIEPDGEQREQVLVIGRDGRSLLTFSFDNTDAQEEADERPNTA